MEAEDRGAGGDAEDAPGQAVPGDPGSPGGPGGQEGPGRGGAGDAGAQAGEAPQVAAALNAPGPGGDAMPRAVTENLGPQRFQFSFIVPFRSSVEAEIASEYLSEQPQPQPVVVDQELSVSDNLLTIRLTAEEPDQLVNAFATCLQELTLLNQIMRRILPPVFPVNPRLGKGG